MNWLDRLYRIAPVPVQHGMVSAYGWRWKRLRFGGVFAEEARAFRQRESFDPAQWRAYQEHTLRALLRAAYTQAPTYRAAWESQGITLAHLDQFTLDDLPSLPPLEKDTARDTPEALLIGGKPAPRHIVFHTSGSTGTPVRTYWLPEELQRSLALRESRSCGFAGVSFTLPRATFSGRIVEPDPESRGPFYRFNWFEKQVYFSAFHLRPDTAEAYVRALRKHNIAWITGYSNSIHQLATMIQDQGLTAPTLKAVITTSEKVTPAMRAVIEAAFNTQVYEEYGMVEDVVYGCECAAGRLHVNPDAGILEIVDEQFRPVPPGQIGEVLATGFIRRSQPMIRYRLGDLAVWDDQPCPCGRQMPVLKEVIGRIEDTVYAPDGRRMVRFHGIFIDQPHIREGQIIQEHLDHLRVRVVPKPGFGPADERDIIQRIQQRLTAQVQVTVEPVDHIERTASGKFQAVISRLSPEEVNRVRRQT